MLMSLGPFDDQDGKELVYEEEAAHWERRAERLRAKLLKRSTREAKAIANGKRQERLERDWRQLEAVDPARIALTEQKAVLFRLKPDKLDQISTYFTSRIWAVKREGGAKEGLDRVEIASIAWQALMESLPMVAQLLGRIKTTYDRRVLDRVVKIEDEALARAHQLVDMCMKEDDIDVFTARPVKLLEEEGLATKISKSRSPVQALKSVEPREPIRKDASQSARIPTVDLERDGLPPVLSKWLTESMRRMRMEIPDITFGEVLTVLTLSMENLTTKVQATNRKLGEVFTNLWNLLLQLFRDLGQIRHGHISKRNKRKLALKEAQANLEENLRETLVRHDALVSQRKKEARTELVNLQGRLRMAESRFNYQKMKIMIREGDIQKLRIKESKLKRKTIALVNRRMVREIINLAHLVEDAHEGTTPEEDRERLQKELDEALDRHRELQDEIFRVFTPSKPVATTRNNTQLRKRSMEASFRLARGASVALVSMTGDVGTRLRKNSIRGGLLNNPQTATPASRDRRKVARQRQQQEAERKDQEKRKTLLTNTKNMLDTMVNGLKDLEHSVNYEHRLAGRARTRDARVQVDSSDLVLRKSTVSDSKRRWVLHKGVWITKRKLANEKTNPFVPPEFIILISSLPVIYKCKPVSTKNVNRLILQILLDHHHEETAGPISTYEEYRNYVYDFFGRKYGLPQIAEPKLVDFLDSLRRSSANESVLADLFCRMLNMDRPGTGTEQAPDDSLAAVSKRNIDPGDFDFIESTIAILLEPGQEGCLQGPVEDKDSGRLFVDVNNTHENFGRLMSILPPSRREQLWSKLQTNLMVQLRLNPKLYSLPKGASRGSTLDLLPVDEVTELFLEHWQNAKERVLTRLGALFVAADSAQDGILAAPAFSIAVRAINPGLSKRRVEVVYDNALKRGANSETVQHDDFVAACFELDVFSAADWENGEGGIAKLAKTHGVFKEEDMSLQRLKSIWDADAMDVQLAIQMLDSSASTPALEAQVVAHRQRMRHVTHLIIIANSKLEAQPRDAEQDVPTLPTPSSSSLNSASGVARRMPSEIEQACWYAYWLLRYELDKVRRDKEVSTALGSVQFLMRWKLRMREILGISDDDPNGSIFRAKLKNKRKKVIHPIFSRCRWHRTDDFLAFLSGTKIYVPGESDDEVGIVKFVSDNPSEIDINIVDDCQNSLLHVAVQNGHDDYVQILLDRGVNVDLQNMTGQTAMHFAKAYDLKRIFFMLRRAGANDKIINKAGLTCHEMEEAS